MVEPLDQFMLEPPKGIDSNMAFKCHDNFKYAVQMITDIWKHRHKEY